MKEQGESGVGMEREGESRVEGEGRVGRERERVGWVGTGREQGGEGESRVCRERGE